MKKNKKLFKKSKPQKTPQEESQKKSNTHKILFILLVIFSTVIVLGFVGISLLIILIKFTSLKNITAQNEASINFSYFVTNPSQLASSKALIVYDASSNVSILTKNENLRFAPASTAKIMAALVTLEEFAPDTILTVDTATVQKEGSKMGLFLGERISVLNLLYGMMLPSGNDAAYLLASSYPGGVDAFVKRMNSKAKELGLENTHFIDPSGYDDDNYSTAYDLAILGSYALKNPLLSQIIQTREVTVYSADQSIPHTLENLNELLEIPGVNGIKTGFTNEAEGVLVTSFAHLGKNYVIVVLRSQDRFQDTKGLINGIINDLKSEKITF